jgi:hypothetical protein
MHIRPASDRMQLMLQNAVTDAMSALAGRSPEKLQLMSSSSLGRRADSAGGRGEIRSK